MFKIQFKIQFNFQTCFQTCFQTYFQTFVLYENSSILLNVHSTEYINTEKTSRFKHLFNGTGLSPQYFCGKLIHKYFDNIYISNWKNGKLNGKRFCLKNYLRYIFELVDDQIEGKIFYFYDNGELSDVYNNTNCKDIRFSINGKLQSVIIYKKKHMPRKTICFFENGKIDKIYSLLNNYKFVIDINENDVVVNKKKIDLLIGLGSLK